MINHQYVKKSTKRLSFVSLWLAKLDKLAKFNFSGRLFSKKFKAMLTLPIIGIAILSIISIVFASAVTGGSPVSYFDETPVNVTINQTGSQIDPTSNPTIKFTAVFSRAINVATFTNDTVFLTGTATGKTVTGIMEVAPNDGTTFEITTTASGYGTIVAEITPGGVNSSEFGAIDQYPINFINDSVGNIYTANPVSNDVTKITPAGVSSIFGSTGDSPYGITIDADGNIYTSNVGSNDVSKITPAGVSSILGTTGNTPYDITIDSAGNVYTANYSSDDVSKITPAGVSSILGTTGTSPYGITIDLGGNIYTANTGSNDVSKITPGGVSSILGTTGNVDTAGSGPYEITTDLAGNVYTSNIGFNNVTKITPAGVSSILGTTGSYPGAIATDFAGNIYTSNSNSNNVTKITPTGDSSILAITGTEPKGIVIDSARNIYTVNLSSQNVTKITQTGIDGLDGGFNAASTSNDNEVTYQEINTLATPVINPIDNNDTVITGTGQANASIDVVGASCINTPINVDSSDNWFCTLSQALTAGSTVSATQSDNQGNTSTPSQVTVSDASTGSSSSSSLSTSINVSSSSVDGSDSSSSVLSSSSNTDSSSSILTSSSSDSESSLSLSSSSSSLSTSVSNDSSVMDSSSSISLSESSNITLSSNSGTSSSDISANISSSSNSTDTIAPSAPVVNSPVSGSTTTNTMPTFLGTGEVNATIQIKDEAGNTQCTTTVDSNGEWTCEFTFSQTEGSHTYLVSQTDQAGNLSPNSSPVTITFDIDTDSAPKSVEDAAPNSGDNNGDGIMDSDQGYVTSKPNNLNSNLYASLDMGTTGCNAISNFDFVAESSLGAQDNNIEYPVGLFDFTVRCATPGESLNITLVLDKVYNTSNWVYRKYNPTTQTYAVVPGVTYGAKFVGTNSVTTISFQAVEGGLLDQDGVANGLFSDPSGPSIFNASNPAPVTSPEATTPSTTNANRGGITNISLPNNNTTSTSVDNQNLPQNSVKPSFVSENPEGVVSNLNSSGNEETSVNKQNAKPTLTRTGGQSDDNANSLYVTLAAIAILVMYGTIMSKFMKNI